MKSQAELQSKLREIDHKGYKAYKVLEGEYSATVLSLASSDTDCVGICLCPNKVRSAHISSEIT